MLPPKGGGWRLIIYHSREALTARLAGLLHAGRLPPAPNPAQAWEAAEAAGAYAGAGLWRAGEGLRGESVFAVGRASRPEVVARVFQGLAALFGIDARRYLLVSVGPDQAYDDLGVIALRRVGLHRLARRVEEGLIARRWPAAAAAAAEGRRKADGLAPGP